MTVGGAPSRVVSWSNTSIVDPGAEPRHHRQYRRHRGRTRPATAPPSPSIPIPPSPASRPAAAPVGTPVTITGTGLLDGGGKAHVTFNGTPATILSQSSYQHSGRRPGRRNHRTGQRLRQRQHREEFQPPLPSPPPQISGLSPNYGAPAALINITGLQLRRDPGQQLRHHQRRALRGDRLVGYLDHHSRAIQRLDRQPGGQRSAEHPATARPSPSIAYPAITSVSPGSGAVGTPVTITGSNLLDGGNNATVTFNGTPAAIVSDTASQIRSTSQPAPPPDACSSESTASP